MFKSARLRLTLLYCGVFFLIFWLFSSGLYFWMSQSFGESYISKVSQAQVQQTGNHSDTSAESVTTETATIAGDISLSQLRIVLLALNGLLLIVVPGVAWILTERTLRPVRRAYEQQRDFVSDASHELRTPLTVMNGELDLALRKKRTSADYKAALMATQTETKRLEQLVSDLLTLAQSDEVALPLTASHVDIQKSLTAVTRRLQPYAKNSHITIQLKKAPSRMLVAGSSAMLERVFENIITNALKFSPPNTNVEIKTITVNDTIRIAFVDHGEGMSAQTIARAFDRFYRGSQSRTDHGTGLGLAISKSTVEHHNGTIIIESIRNQGTTVTITLPSAVRSPSSHS
jgi:signal transduction histidine kinase